MSILAAQIRIPQFSVPCRKLWERNRVQQPLWFTSDDKTFLSLSISWQFGRLNPWSRIYWNPLCEKRWRKLLESFPNVYKKIFFLSPNYYVTVTKSFFNLFYIQLIARNRIAAKVLILKHDVLDGIWCHCKSFGHKINWIKLVMLFIMPCLTTNQAKGCALSFYSSEKQSGWTAGMNFGGSWHSARFFSSHV